DYSCHDGLLSRIAPFLFVTVMITQVIVFVIILVVYNLPAPASRNGVTQALYLFLFQDRISDPIFFHVLVQGAEDFKPSCNTESHFKLLFCFFLRRSRNRCPASPSKSSHGRSFFGRSSDGIEQLRGNRNRFPHIRCISQGVSILCSSGRE